MKKKDKLRIAMFGQKFVPSREGGIEVVVEELTVRMAEMGHDVTCYNRSGRHAQGSNDDGRKKRIYKGIKMRSVPTINGRGFAATSSAFTAAVLAAFGKHDVVHVHAEGPAIMCWIPKLFGKKIVVTIHGLDHQRAKWGRFASWFILNGEKNAVRFADEIIVLSRGVQEYFAKTYNRKTTFIPNGIKYFEPAPAKLITEKWGLEKDGYFLYLSRVVPEKCSHLLVEAFRKVKTDKKLVIAGESGDADEYSASVKKLAEGDDRIIFAGFVDGQLLAELYSNAYVYTLPSNLEGMPMSLLEAMSYGNCCLTSDIAECVEVVEDKAVTFKKGSASDLREKIEMLIGDPETVLKYRNGSSDFIRGKYNWEDVTEKTLRLYRR